MRAAVVLVPVCTPIQGLPPGRPLQFALSAAGGSRRVAHLGGDRVAIEVLSAQVNAIGRHPIVEAAVEVHVVHIIVVHPTGDLVLQ